MTTMSITLVVTKVSTTFCGDNGDDNIKENSSNDNICGDDGDDISNNNMPTFAQSKQHRVSEGELFRVSRGVLET